MPQVLYNTMPGNGFALSREFLLEYIKRTGGLEMTHVLDIGFRCDPIALAIFNEYGGSWSSHPGSCIEAFNVPEAFASYWKIEHTRIGVEIVHIAYGDALANILHRFMRSDKSSKSLETLESEYARLLDAGSGSDSGYTQYGV